VPKFDGGDFVTQTAQSRLREHREGRDEEGEEDGGVKVDEK
jgi:hypothetical protein